MESQYIRKGVGDYVKLPHSSAEKVKSDFLSTLRFGQTLNPSA